jgi:hypothetical protein
MRQVVIDLFLSSPQGRDRGIIRSLVYLLPVAMIALITHRDLYSGTALPTGTAHPEQSINVALNAAYCGRPSAVSDRYSVQVFLTTRLDLMSVPFRNVIAAQAGSVDNYCRTLNERVVVSENSLMWLTRLALWWNPHLTPDLLGDFLGACRVFMLLVFGLALLRTGASVAFTLAAVVIGTEILRRLGVRDSIYPFVMTLPLLHAGLYGWAASLRSVRNGRAGLWLFALGMGILTAFSASMRTLHLPMCVAMFCLFLAALYARRDRSRPAATLAAPLGGAAIAFAAGYGAYVAVLVAPLRIPDDASVSNYVYHTFAHQLVLGLAVPENDLSRREGIKWDDMVGFALARRAIPDVTYIGPRYEEALLKYYRGLWQRYPRDMVRVYLAKLRSDGDEVFLSAARIGSAYSIPPAIGESLHKATNGFVLILTALGVWGVGLIRHIRGRGNRLLMVSMVGFAALTSLAEGFVVYSIFVGIYASILLYFVFLVFFLLIQAALDGLARTLVPAVFRNTP